MKMYRATYNLFESLQAAFVTGGAKRQQEPDNPKPTVLLVGYGWGGKAFSDRIDRNKYNVHVVTADPYFLNTPKLVRNLVSGYDNSSKINQLRVQNLHFGKCVQILPNTNTADFELALNGKSKFSLGYDYLVLAVGSVPNTFNIPGAETCKFLKTFDGMSNLRRIIKNGDPDSINIIGAGPTGVELALALAADSKEKPVRLIEAAGGILGGFSDVTRTAVMKDLEAHSVKIELGTAVSAVEEKYVLANSGKKVFPNDLTIWTSGVKPSPLIEALIGPGGPGRVIVDSNFLLKGYKNIYAIGDIVASREHGPPTAQNARAQGYYLADHFNVGFHGEGYKYKEVGKILHGSDKIYVEYKGQTHLLPKSLGFIVDWITAP